MDTIASVLTMTVVATVNIGNIQRITNSWSGRITAPLSHYKLVSYIYILHSI